VDIEGPVLPAITTGGRNLEIKERRMLQPVAWMQCNGIRGRTSQRASGVPGLRWRFIQATEGGY